MTNYGYNNEGHARQLSPRTKRALEYLKEHLPPYVENISFDISGVRSIKQAKSLIKIIKDEFNQNLVA